MGAGYTWGCLILLFWASNRLIKRWNSLTLVVQTLLLSLSSNAYLQFNGHTNGSLKININQCNQCEGGTGNNEGY